MKKLGILLLACITALNLWAEVFKIGKFRYEIETPTTVRLISADADITKVLLCETIDYEGNSYTLTYIGEEAFKDCSSLKSVIIPNSVTSIEYGAFKDCSSLKSVIIPNSVTSIGGWAFEGCSSLTSVTIPNSVTWIGGSAFEGCTSLTSMVVASGNSTYDSRDNCNAIIETATNTLIFGCQNTTIPNSVTSIGDLAFSGCTSLTSVTIPESVKWIGEVAFEDCSSLKSVTIPNSVTSIGDQAFSGCKSLKSVTISNSVASMGEVVFGGGHLADFRDYS